MAQILKEEKLIYTTHEVAKIFGVRIDIWTHLMRGCIINYVH